MLERKPQVAIVDHGLGNLFSVKHACECVGMVATITPDRQEILAADAVILPGVGAFGDAMQTLRRLDLVRVLQDIAQSSTPLIGICLGVQLLMSRSYEFGCHEGLGIIDGVVVRLEHPRERGRDLKVPQVGWNRISTAADGWSDTLLRNVPDHEFMYFVHSYVVQPADPTVVLSTTRYGDIDFCSSVRRGSVFACQFHPERSGPQGLRVYRNLVAQIEENSKARKHAHVG